MINITSIREIKPSLKVQLRCYIQSTYFYNWYHSDKCTYTCPFTDFIFKALL